jgi:DNA-binding transcriptional LysR family regulator
VASFLALVEEGHYGRAAARLHLTSPALTKRVQRLERHIGAPLLERDGTGVVGLTPAGRSLAREAGTLLAHARAARAAARAEAEPLVLRLGVLGRVGDHPDRQMLEDAAGRLRQIYPEARLSCRGIPFTAMTDCVLERAVDVLCGVSEDWPTAVEVTPLVRFERLGVVPAQHDMAEADEVSAAEFAELPLLYHPAVPRSWMDPFLLTDVRARRDARALPIWARDAPTVFDAVAQGRGAAITSALFSSQPLTAPGIRTVRLRDLPLVTHHTAHRRGDRRGAVRALVDILTRVLAGDGRRASHVRELSPPAPAGPPGPGRTGAAGR